MLAASRSRRTPTSAIDSSYASAACSCAPTSPRHEPLIARILAISSGSSSANSSAVRSHVARPRIVSAEELDVPELAMRGGRHRPLSRGLGGGDASVERGRALLVLPFRGVYERRSPARAAPRFRSRCRRMRVRPRPRCASSRSRPRSLPRLTAASPDSRSACSAARPPPTPTGGRLVAIAPASASSGPGSTPSSRRNRSSDAESWRSTATSSPVAANARTRSTCASSFNGSAATNRVASSTAVRTLPEASARSAPSRRTASLSPWRCRRSPSNHAAKPGTRVDFHALEQLAPEPGELDRLARRASHQDLDIDHRARREAELDHVPAARPCRVLRAGAAAPTGSSAACRPGPRRPGTGGR